MTETTDTSQDTPRATAELRPERLGQHEKLRPERLGQREELRPERLGQPLTAGEVGNHLAQVPGWETTDHGQALARTFAFPSLRAAVAFIALVAEISEQDGYVPDMDLRLLEVTVRIDTQVGEPLTALDFQVARSLGWP